MTVTGCFCLLHPLLIYSNGFVVAAGALQQFGKMIIGAYVLFIKEQELAELLIRNAILTPFNVFQCQCMLYKTIRWGCFEKLAQPFNSLHF